MVLFEPPWPLANSSPLLLQTRRLPFGLQASNVRSEYRILRTHLASPATTKNSHRRHRTPTLGSVTFEYDSVAPSNSTSVKH